MIGKKLGLGNPVSGGYDSDRTVFSVDVSGVRPVARAVLVDGVYDMSGWMGGLVVRVSVGGKFPSQRLSVLAEHLMLLSLVILLAKSFFDGWCLDRKRFTICCFFFDGCVPGGCCWWRSSFCGRCRRGMVVGSCGGELFQPATKCFGTTPEFVSVFYSFGELCLCCLVLGVEEVYYSLFFCDGCVRRAGVGVFIVNVNGYFVGEICVSLKFVVFIGNYSLTF